MKWLAMNACFTIGILVKINQLRDVKAKAYVQKPLSESKKVSLKQCSVFFFKQHKQFEKESTIDNKKFLAAQNKRKKT